MKKRVIALLTAIFAILCLLSCRSQENERVIKAQIVSDKIFLLSNKHNLYTCSIKNDDPMMDSIALKHEEIADFKTCVLGAEETISLLFLDGTVKIKSLNGQYITDLSIKQHHAKAVDFLSVLYDDSVWYFHDGNWGKFDIQAKKVRFDGRSRIIILDKTNSLWSYSIENGAGYKISENVMDFDYTPANHIYTHSEIYYLKDRHLYNLSYNWYDPEDETKVQIFDYDGQSIYSSQNKILICQTDGTNLWGNPVVQDDMKRVDMKVIDAEVRTNSYLIVDAGGKVHFHSDAINDMLIGNYPAVDWSIDLGMKTAKQSPSQGRD